MIDQKLMDYVNSAVKSGKSVQQIENELRNRGWPEEKIRDVIRIVQTENRRLAPKTPSKASKVSHRHVYLVGIAIVAVILVVTAIYVMSVFPPAGGDVIIPDRCGNGICNFGETAETCPSDCQAASGSETSGSLELSVSPATKNIGIGQEFTLDIVLSGGYDIYGFQFDVEYDPGILEFVGAEEGTFLNNGGSDNTFCLDEKASAGLIKNLVCTRLGKGSVNGDGVLERLTFKSISEGNSGIILKNVKISNSVPAQVDSNIRNGEAIVS